MDLNGASHPGSAGAVPFRTANFAMRVDSVGRDACDWVVLEWQAPANWPEFVLVAERLAPRRRVTPEQG
jgi:hypothetical protein